MNKGVIKKTLKYLSKDIITLIIVLLLGIASVILTIYLPMLIGNAIDLIIGINNVKFDLLKNLLLKIIIIIACTGIIDWIILILTNKMTFRITKKLRQESFRKLQKLPLKYLDSHPTGEVVSVIINDVDQFADGLLLGFTQLFKGIITIVGTLVFMFMLNWVVTLIVLFVTPLSIFAAKFIAGRTYKMFKSQAEIRALQTGLIDEMVTNIKVIKAYNYEDDSLAKFKETNDLLGKCSLKAIFYSSLTNPVTRFVNSLVYALTALAGSIFIIKEVSPSLVLTIGNLTTLLSYANQYTKPFNEISSVITEVQNAFACATRVFNLLEEKEEVQEGDVVLDLNNPNKQISINNVYFSYIEGQKLIENFNLNVAPGKRIAIVGPTGCGKTTLINLLMRFYDVTDGSIKIDNTDIRDITRKSLRNNYGMVLQDTWIKTKSVRDNIAIGKPDASLEEIIEAAKQAHADSFIKRLPQGYDTIISEDNSLSIGQKQLLSITRVMLVKPDMLILDEATSSIDTRTELKIQDAFNTLMKGKTSFIVAHRLSTIKEADLILVMNNGNIIEQGNHQELLAKNGFYAKLYNSQFEE